MNQLEWKDLYKKIDGKPNITMLENYLNQETLVLFHKFDEIMRNRFGLGSIFPLYSPSNGWMYQYGYSGFIFVRKVFFINNTFNVENIEVKDENSLGRAIEIIQNRYDSEFRERFEEFRIKRSERQKERNKKVSERKKQDIEKNKAIIDKAKFNIFKWSPKVSLNKLRRLYETSVTGNIDSDLLDDIGYSLYTRCIQGLSGPKCTNCSEDIMFVGGKNDIVTCQCGYQYTYGGYKESYYRSKLPHGAAIPAFKTFMSAWEKAKNDNEKMICIDILVHAFHVSLLTGRGYRSVAENLLKGTWEEQLKLLNDLAYGDKKIAEKNDV